MSKSPVATFLERNTMKTVDGEDIPKDGDWILKWNRDDATDTDTGFTLYTPSDFDETGGKGPMGGLLLAAVYFILEHGEENFPKDTIKMANNLADNLMSLFGEDFINSKKTLN